MDKLLVDLDQVLDDLEESEKNNQNYAFNQPNCLSLIEELKNDQSLSNANKNSNQSNRLDLLVNDNLEELNYDKKDNLKCNEFDNCKIDDLMCDKLDKKNNLKSDDNDKFNNDNNLKKDIKLNKLDNDDLLKNDNLKRLDDYLKELSENDLLKDKDNNDDLINNIFDTSNNQLNNPTNQNKDNKLSSNQQSSIYELNYEPSYETFKNNLNNNLIREKDSNNTSSSFNNNSSFNSNNEINQNSKCEQLKNDFNKFTINDQQTNQSTNRIDNLIYKNDNYLNDEDINFNNYQLLGKESTNNLINDNCISLKDELLIEEKKGSNDKEAAVNKMSDNPFEEDNNLDNNNLDNNLNSNLDSSNNLNVNSQKLTSSSAKSFNEEDHLNSSCSVNESLSVDAKDSNSNSNTQKPPEQLVSNFQTSNTTDNQPTTTFSQKSDLNQTLNQVDNFSHAESVNIVDDNQNNENNIQNNNTTAAEITNENNTTILNESTAINTTNENIDTSTNLDDIFSNSVGYLKPYWQPDKEAPACMFCNAKFNIFIRRHHCRACGKIGCSVCCHYFIKLPYLGFKESRVCKVCVNLLDCLRDSEIDSRRSSRTSSISNNNNQIDSSISDLSIATNSTNMGAIMPTTSNSQIRPIISNQPSSPILVPVSVLKKPDRTRAETQPNKQVKFADGIVPGTDLFSENQSTTNNSKSNNSSNSNTISSSFPSLSTFSTLLFSNSSPSSSNSPKSTEQQINSTTKKSTTKNKKDNYNLDLILHDLNGPLPPLINSTSLVPESTFADIVNYLDSDDSNCLKFQITKNLCVIVNRVYMDCCTKMKCWSFYSEGLASFGQDEILILLESLDAEVYFPRDVLRLYLHVYDNALKGKPLQENNLMLFEEGLFESRDNSGFLFFRHSYQCLNKIKKPQSPFICGILIQKWEIPFSKLLPLRLLLRLGTQSKSYPFPLVSQWSRKQVFQEIGHTIMNLLADFRNFQYTLPFIPGLYVQLHLLPNNKHKVVVKIANNRHDLVLKALNSSSNSVLSFGSNFDLSANYHLTCLQNDDQYLTQIFSKNGDVNDFNLNNLESNNEYISEIIGVSYIVFSGALKSEAGLNAKNSIVEDGILVQVLPASLEKLKNALKQKTDFTLNCGQDETVSIVWTEDDLQFNLGVKSQIDNKSLQGVQSIRIYNNNGGCSSERYLIRWTEVFFLQYDLRRSINNVEYTRMASLIAQSFLVLLTPHLEKLTKENIRKISLRVNLEPDNVDNYAVSTNVGPMPTYLTTEIDSSLIPLIIQLQTNELDQKLIIELLFFILNK